MLLMAYCRVKQRRVSEMPRRQPSKTEVRFRTINLTTGFAEPNARSMPLVWKIAIAVVTLVVAMSMYKSADYIGAFSNFEAGKYSSLGDAKVADEKISIKIEPTIPEVVPVISPEPPVVKAAEPVEAPISPTVPPSTSNFDLCPASAAAPTASTGLNSMSPRSITIGGLVITVEVTQLQLCRPTRVILRLPADQSPQDIDTDGPGGGIGVDVFVIFYTNASAPEPSGCLSLTSPECQRRVRQLPLSYSAENDAMIATLFPDPTSMHYSFVVQASTASSDCLVTPTLIPLGFQDRHPQPEMILLLNHGLGYVCHPVLHLDIPAMYDFYITLPQDGGFTQSAPQHFKLPKTSNGRLCVGCSLQASYGKNRLLVKYPALLAKLWPEHVKNVTLYGRLISEKYIINVNPDLFHDPILGGYVVDIDIRDPGQLFLWLAVGWYFGGTDPKLEPAPLSVGGHMGDHYRESDIIRAFVHGGVELKLELREELVKETPEVPRFGKGKCDHGDTPARWINMEDKPCAPPFCTGNRSDTVNNIDTNYWVKKVWVYVPHDCYFHLYDKADLYRCAAEDGVNWIHSMGDSQEREFVSLLKQVNGSLVSVTKYMATDFEMVGSSNHLRVTWQFFSGTVNSQETYDLTNGREFKYDKNFLDHFMVAISPDAGLPLPGVDLPNKEDVRPDVFVMNQANAHAGKYQPLWTHKRWIDDFVKYIDGGKMLTNPPSVPDRPGLSKPMRLIWYSAPSVFAHARPGNIYLSTHRAALFTQYSEAAMRSIGVPIADNRAVTQSRWEASYDGLHYASTTSGDNWASQVASMEYQVVMNVIFPKCGALPQPSPKPPKRRSRVVCVLFGAMTIAIVGMMASFRYKPDRFLRQDVHTGPIDFEGPSQEVRQQPTQPIAPARQAPTSFPTTSCCDSASFITLTPQISTETALNFTTAGGLGYEIRVPPMNLCAPVVLTFLPLQAIALASVSLDADELMALLDVTAWVHVYTASNLTGASCESLSVNCTSFTRPLPLSLDVATGTVVASFVPDPGSMHYVFSFSDVSGTVCKHTPLFIPLKSIPVKLPYPADRPRPALFEGFGFDCHPILQFNSPSASDYYIKQLPKEPLTASAPQSADPLPIESRVCFGCSLKVVYGVNRFLVSYPRQLAAVYPNHVKKATLYGRLVNHEYIINVYPSLVHDDELRGYVVEFDIRDPGTFVLQMMVGWYFGDTDPTELPVPVYVGSHVGHHYIGKEASRALIHNTAPVDFTLQTGAMKETPDRPRFGKTKCDHGDSEGRWVNMGSKACEPPYCTGDRSKTVNNLDFDGSVKKDWVWVPYDCYHHLYSKTDIYGCASKLDIDWIHAMGDSQEREFVSVLKMVNGSVETVTPYIAANFHMHGSPNKLRITWQFYEITINGPSQYLASNERRFEWDQFYFDHFNFAPSKTSGMPFANLALPAQEDTRPDVYIMNHANAHAGKYEPLRVHKRWFGEFLDYIKNGTTLTNPEQVEGRPGVSRPARFIWFSAPRVVSQGKEENVYVTTHRTMTFEKVATDAMRGMGFPILDAGKITQSRWESSYDGLHYLLQYSLDNWASHTSNMIAQAMLNVLFQSCGEVKDGDPFLSPTPTPSAAPIGGSTNVDKDCIPQGNPIPPNAAISTNIPSNSKFTTSSGRVYSLSTNDDVMSCYHTYFQLIPDNSPDLSSLEDNPDVKVIVHFYTNSSAPGTFCESNGPTCVLMSRQLPLRINEGFNGLVAIFVPDPASKHYVFTVTDSAPSGKCWSSGVVTTKGQYKDRSPQYADHPAPGMNPGVGYECSPVLHLGIPAMHDFELAIVPGGGLEIQYPPNVQNKFQLSRNRVCLGCSLKASYGVNKFAVLYPPLLASLYPEHVKDYTVYGRLLNNEYMVKLNVSLFPEEGLNGYTASFDLRDPGKFTFQIGISFFFGSADPGSTPIPLCVSCHMTYHYRESNLIRSFVHGGYLVPVVLAQESLQESESVPRWGLKRCDHSDSLGRWVNMLDKPCSPPYCSGNRTATVNSIDSHFWLAKTWLYIPHDCYFHMFSKEDIYTCGARDKVDWIHAMGDSQEREFVSMMKMVNGSTDTYTKYQACSFNMAGSPNNMRVSWQFYELTLSSPATFESTNFREFSFDQKYFDHFNLGPSATSGAPAPPLGLGDEEPTRPSVFVLNHANAHAGKYQSYANVQAWMAAFKKYLQDTHALDTSISIPGRPGLGPSRIIWFSAPSTFCQARVENVYMSSLRTTLFTLHAESVMRSLGIPIVDGRSITSTRWDASYDGLHYAAATGATGDAWYSQVTSMVHQAVVNSIFPTCTGKA